MTNPADTLARTIWGECRSGGSLGMHAVANIILNRANNPRWWGTDIVSVCRQPYQFSCWNADDPNLPKLEAVTVADHEFAEAMALATTACAGHLVDLTKNADSYYARSMREAPYWVGEATLTYEDAWHRFYRTELAPFALVAPVDSTPTVAASVVRAPAETPPPVEDVADQLDDRFNPPPS
jgi:N-acetylmuramoyl-L-alanine amidase